MRIVQQRMSLELINAGPLQPWLGPAVRGMVSLALKEVSCTIEPMPEVCCGCERQRECAYGTLLEPDTPEGGRDGIRPVVMAPAFPLARSGRRGQKLGLTITTTGARAELFVEPLIEMIQERGRRDGFGQASVRFSLQRGGWAIHELQPWELPATPGTVPGVVPRLGVELLSPLVLKQRQGEERTLVTNPMLGDLVEAAIRLLKALFEADGTKLSVDEAGLLAAARQAPLVEDHFEPFRQKRLSRKRHQTYEMEGITGRGVYTGVPMALVPWLLWAGRMHVGGHRVAGAGSWRLTLE